MILTNEEREKFATYLERNAADNLAMVEQMKNALVAAVFPEAVVDLLKMDANAFLYVAGKLRSIEKQSIGPG